MEKLWIKFLEEPNAENFLALREIIIKSASYQPYSQDLEEMQQLLQQKEWQKIIDLTTTCMPNLLISPRAHGILSYANKMLESLTESKMEGYIAHCCAQGILATGDGTKEKPYIVTRTSDEYDLLEHQSLKLKQQSLQHDKERSYDVLETTGGEKIWFDITEPYLRLNKVFDGTH